MDKLRESTDSKAYNQSLSLLQSSGFGKSCLVNKVAGIKFCFPFNIREPESDSYGNIPAVFLYSSA
jgi:ABC-type nitrate/sulfonate/bicarbonate transport system ATPase subunit